MAILIRRRVDTKANWETANPVIPDRQLVFTEDAGGTGIDLFKIGNGADNWSDLPYFNKKNNLEALSDPTTSNDDSQNYSIGSLWSNVSTPSIPKVFILTDLSSGAEWVQINAGGGGGGDVSGPVSSTDNAIARWDGTGGDTIQNSGVIIDDSDVISGANRVQSKVFNQDAIVTLVDGATVDWDFDDGDLVQLTIAGNRTINAPTNIRTGVKTLRIIQDGTGGRTLTWNAAYEWVSGTAPVLNSGAGEETYISFFTDGTRVVGIGATEAFLTEAELINTSRQFINGQGMTNSALSITTNQTDIDFSVSNSFTLDMDSNTELQLPTNDRPFSAQVLVTNNGGNTLTFATGYRVLGDTPSAVDTDLILLNISSFADGNPWVVVNNQP